MFKKQAPVGMKFVMRPGTKVHVATRGSSVTRCGWWTKGRVNWSDAILTDGTGMCEKCAKFYADAIAKANPTDPKGQADVQLAKAMWAFGEAVRTELRWKTVETPADPRRMMQLISDFSNESKFYVEQYVEGMKAIGVPAPKPALEWRPDKFYNRSYYAERDGSRFEVYRDNLVGMWTLYAKDAEGNIVSGTEYYPTMALAKAAAEDMEPTHA